MLRPVCPVNGITLANLHTHPLRASARREDVLKHERIVRARERAQHVVLSANKISIFVDAEVSLIKLRSGA